MTGTTATLEDEEEGMDYFNTLSNSIHNRSSPAIQRSPLPQWPTVRHVSSL